MISIKTKEEIKVMAEGGKILSSVVSALGEKLAVGVNGSEIEKLAEAMILENGGECNFKGQDGFPSCLCFSVNEEIVHGVPEGKILKDGDIVTIDLGIFFPLTKFVKDIDMEKYPNLKDGFHTDMARTYAIGGVSPEAQKLINASKNALEEGIRKVRSGNTFGELGEAIQEYAKSQGFDVIRDLCGHGIGAELHEDPDVLNYGRGDHGDTMEEGMVFCIEPMLTAGSHKIRRGEGIVYTTDDGSLSAHFEDMVAVTADGVLVLTK